MSNDDKLDTDPDKIDEYLEALLNWNTDADERIANMARAFVTTASSVMPEPAEAVCALGIATMMIVRACAPDPKAAMDVYAERLRNSIAKFSEDDAALAFATAAIATGRARRDAASPPPETKA